MQSAFGEKPPSSILIFDLSQLCSSKSLEIGTQGSRHPPPSLTVVWRVRRTWCGPFQWDSRPVFGPVQRFELKIISSLYSGVLVRVFSLNLSRDEALLQKHQSKTMPVCKWQKVFKKLATVKELMKVYFVGKCCYFCSRKQLKIIVGPWGCWQISINFQQFLECQNNPCAIEAHFGVAYSATKHPWV